MHSSLLGPLLLCVCTHVVSNCWWYNVHVHGVYIYMYLVPYILNTHLYIHKYGMVGEPACHEVHQETSPISIVVCTRPLLLYTHTTCKYVYSMHCTCMEPIIRIFHITYIHVYTCVYMCYHGNKVWRWLYLPSWFCCERLMMLELWVSSSHGHQWHSSHPHTPSPHPHTHHHRSGGDWGWGRMVDRGQWGVGREWGGCCTLTGDGETRWKLIPLKKNYFKLTCLLGERENNFLHASELSFDLVPLTTPPSKPPSMGDHSGKFPPGDRTNEDTAVGAALCPPGPVGKIWGEGEGV